MIKRKITRRLKQMRKDGGKYALLIAGRTSLNTTRRTHCGKSIVFNDGTLGDEGEIRYEPIYMSMFLEKGTLPEKLIYDIGAPV